MVKTSTIWKHTTRSTGVQLKYDGTKVKVYWEYGGNEKGLQALELLLFPFDHIVQGKYQALTKNIYSFLSPSEMLLKDHGWLVKVNKHYSEKNE